MAAEDRPRRRGVSVETRETPAGPRYIARYTLADGKRPSLPAHTSWYGAFAAASALQDKVDRSRFRDPGGGRMTFAELVLEHYLPLQPERSPVTSRTIASHLGDATGRPRGAGAKAERAARLSLLSVFGRSALSDIGPQHVRAWQADLLRERYLVSTILAKRSLLRGVLQVAVVNGWIDVNPVDAVPKPRARQTSDEDRVLTPSEWARLVAALSGRETQLLCRLALDTGLRFGEVSALRACDVVDATDTDPQHVWVRQSVSWPGHAYSDGDTAWQLKEPKGRRWRKVAVAPGLFHELLDHVERCCLRPEALLFDAARVRAEHDRREDRPAIGKGATWGRYAQPGTGRSGEHGRSSTYDLGCRCPACRNASSEARFWWARARGRQSARPWLEPGFVAARSDAVDPIVPSWFGRVVWRPAVQQAGLDWSPTFHDLRHASVTWALEGGASLQSVRRDSGHASLRTTEVYVHRLDRRVDSSRISALQRMYDKVQASAPPDFGVGRG